MEAKKRRKKKKRTDETFQPYQQEKLSLSRNVHSEHIGRLSKNNDKTNKKPSKNETKQTKQRKERGHAVRTWVTIAKSIKAASLLAASSVQWAENFKNEAHKKKREKKKSMY